MLQQRVVVNSEIRWDDLKRYFYFSDIYMGRSMIPIALAGVAIGLLMVFAGGTGPIVGGILILTAVIYGFSFRWRCNKFMERNGHEVGRKNRITVDKRNGIVVEELTINNIEEYSWQQINSTGENKNMFVFILPESACYIPKSDMDPEDADFLSRICAAKKGAKHKKV
ncbi:MAG: YcxB family protein [Firmicutes bacterium]|nr:YcxB family protein [Bacillota bacterium]